MLFIWFFMYKFIEVEEQCIYSYFIYIEEVVSYDIGVQCDQLKIYIEIMRF